MNVQEARQVDIAAYLMERGVALKRSGRRYKHPEHDSLVFTGNAYFWNSRGEHGNAVDYLVRHYSMDFKTAVAELTKENFAGQGKKVEDPEPFTFSEIKTTANLRRGIAYLTKTRGISSDIVQRLIKDKLMFLEADTNNLIFPMYDEGGAVVGAEKQGTLSRYRFKGVAAGSKYGYGYNIRMSESLKYALFFESAVDMLSYWQLAKKAFTGCLLVSVAGLKSNVIKHLTVVFGGLQPVLCVDNDPAGREFADSYKNVIKRFPMPPAKDWNEQISLVQ